MSIFLLQTANVPAAPTVANAVSSSDKVASSNDGSISNNGTFAGIFNLSELKQNINNKINGKNPQSTDEKVSSGVDISELNNGQDLSAIPAYFPQIIQQFNDDVVQGASSFVGAGANNVNIGKAPDGIKNIASENNFMLQAIAMIKGDNVGGGAVQGDLALQSAPVIEPQIAGDVLGNDVAISDFIVGDASLAQFDFQANISDASQVTNNQAINNNDAGSWQLLQSQDFMGAKMAAIAFVPQNALNGVSSQSSAVIAPVTANYAVAILQGEQGVVSSDVGVETDVVVGGENLNIDDAMDIINPNNGGDKSGFSQNNASQGNSQGNSQNGDSQFSRLADPAILTETLGDFGADISSFGDVFSINDLAGINNGNSEKDIALLRFEEVKNAQPNIASQASSHGAALEQISMQIKRLHANKTGEINLQLNPNELGKVEIRVVSDANNNIMVQVTADSRDTYDLLRNDRASLERILQASNITNNINGNNDNLSDGVGIKFDENSLQFAYREGNNNGGNGGGADKNSNHSHVEATQASALNDAGVDMPSPEQIINLKVTTGINIKV